MLHFVVFSCDSWHFKFAGLDILTIQLWINLWSISFLQRYFFVTSRDSARYKFPTHSKDILIWRLLYSGVGGECCSCMHKLFRISVVCPRGVPRPAQPRAPGTRDRLRSDSYRDTGHGGHVGQFGHGGHCGHRSLLSFHPMFNPCRVDDMLTFHPRSSTSFAVHPESKFIRTIINQCQISSLLNSN